MSDVFQGQNAEILRATIDGTPYTEAPESYIAQLLIELKETIEAGGGGGGGTTNYNGLTNKPQINGVTLQGNKSLQDLSIVIPVVDASLSGTSENPVQNKIIKGALDGKQAKLVFDNVPIEDSNNPVKSGGLFTALAAKQNTLSFDNVPTENSNNPVKSGGLFTALAAKQNLLTFDNMPMQSSNNPVKSNGIYNALVAKVDVTELLNYYNKDEVDALLAALNTLSLEVVESLPTEDISTTTIYLVQISSDPTSYNQYIYMNNAWVLIGTTDVDLTNYYTKTEVNGLLVLKQDVLTFDNSPAQDSNNPVKSGGIYTALEQKQDVLTFDNAPTEDSNNPVKSGGIYSALEQKQDVLTFDNAPTENSNNPVKSGGIYSALEQKQDVLTFDNAPTANSDNPVKSDGIYTAVSDKLTVTNVMPAASAALLNKQRLYVGNTTDTYTKGVIYECQIEPESSPTAYIWVSISSAEVDLTDYETSWTGTQAQWDALTPEEAAKYKIVNILDDNSGITLNTNYIKWEG